MFDQRDMVELVTALDRRIKALEQLEVLSSSNDISAGSARLTGGVVLGGSSSTQAHVGTTTMAERSSAAGVVSGFGQLYCKTDGKLYFRNDAGTETALT